MTWRRDVHLSSTTHRGTAFENRSLKILQDHLSMSLNRVGGKSDGGIDLMGWWWIPDLDTPVQDPRFVRRKRIRVLAQCKAEKKKMGPNYVREMEGVLYRYMVGDMSRPADDTTPPMPSPSGIDIPQSFNDPSQPTVALLLSESPFTKSTLLRALSSPVPFFLLHLPPISNPMAEDDEALVSSDSQRLEPVPSTVTGIGSAVWNPALGGMKGPLKGQVEVRWERPSEPGSGVGRPGLWYAGRRLESWTPGSDESDRNDDCGGLSPRTD